MAAASFVRLDINTSHRRQRLCYDKILCTEKSPNSTTRRLTFLFDAFLIIGFLEVSIFHSHSTSFRSHSMTWLLSVPMAIVASWPQRAFKALFTAYNQDFSKSCTETLISSMIRIKVLSKSATTLYNVGTYFLQWTMQLHCSRNYHLTGTCG